MKKLLLILLFLPLFSKAQLTIRHKFMTIVYDTVNIRPISVTYILKADSLDKSFKFNRTNFHYDRKLPTRLQPNINSYHQNLYDRGHLAPDADFTYNEIAEYDAMSMTNIAPQNPSLNRGLWLKIEKSVRNLSYRFDSLEITTGVLYKSKEQIYGLSVPTHFYKIVNTYKYKLVYLCKNEECLKCEPDDFLIELSELNKLLKK